MVRRGEGPGLGWGASFTGKERLSLKGIGNVHPRPLAQRTGVGQ